MPRRLTGELCCSPAVSAGYSSAALADCWAGAWGGCCGKCLASCGLTSRLPVWPERFCASYSGCGRIAGLGGALTNPGRIPSTRLLTEHAASRAPIASAEHRAVAVMTVTSEVAE